MTNICWVHSLCHSLRQKPEVHGCLRLSSIPPEAHNLADIFHEQSDLLLIPNYFLLCVCVCVCVCVCTLMFRAIILRRVNIDSTWTYLYFLYLYGLIPFHFYIVTYALLGTHKNMRKQDCFFVGGNVNWHGNYGKQHRDSPKKLNRTTMWSSNFTSGCSAKENRNTNSCICFELCFVFQLLCQSVNQHSALLLTLKFPLYISFYNWLWTWNQDNGRLLVLISTK